MRWHPPSAREPNDAKALSYGFFAIGAFLFGGVGFLAGILGMRGLVVHFVAALVSFGLARHHMGEA
jgi:hypothetical protein